MARNKSPAPHPPSRKFHPQPLSQCHHHRLCFTRKTELRWSEQCFVSIEVCLERLHELYICDSCLQDLINSPDIIFKHFQTIIMYVPININELCQRSSKIFSTRINSVAWVTPELCTQETRSESKDFKKADRTEVALSPFTWWICFLHKLHPARNKGICYLLIFSSLPYFVLDQPLTIIGQEILLEDSWNDIWWHTFINTCAFEAINHHQFVQNPRHTISFIGPVEGKFMISSNPQVLFWFNCEKKNNKQIKNIKKHLPVFIVANLCIFCGMALICLDLGTVQYSIISWLLHLRSFPIPRRVVWASEQDTQPGKPLMRNTSNNPSLHLLIRYTCFVCACFLNIPPCKCHAGCYFLISSLELQSFILWRLPFAARWRYISWCSQASTLCVDTATIAARRQSPSPGDFEKLLNSLGPSILTHRCGQFGYATSIEQSKDLIYNRFIMKHQIWYLNISSYLQQGMIRKSPIPCDTRAQWLPMKFKRKIRDLICDFTNLQSRKSLSKSAKKMANPVEFGSNTLPSMWHFYNLGAP